jgi:hypothetical protein
MAAMSITSNVPAGPVGDQTLAVAYPPPNDPQLAPMTKYRFRVVRTGDGRVMGEGSLETAPARDEGGQLCPGRVSRLPGASHNPFVDMNIGLIEVQRQGGDLQAQI